MISSLPRSSEALSTQKSRIAVYSCVFCDFVNTNLFLVESAENDLNLDRAFEAKYLFHLRTVHGLEK